MKGFIIILDDRAETLDRYVIFMQVYDQIFIKMRLLIVGSMCWISLAFKAVLLDFEHTLLSKYPRISEVLNFQLCVEKICRNFCSVGPLH